MKVKIIEQLETAIASCATKAEKASNPVEALQYTQAALNATHALIAILNEYQT